MNIGPAEIIVVLIIALLVFGPKRLPQMGRSLGKGVREFRKAADTAKTELGLGEVTDQINEVKSTFGDLKSSVDVKAAVEAPVETKTGAGAGVAGATVVAATAAGPLTPDPSAGPEAPATAAAPDDAVVAAPLEPIVEAPDEPVVVAPEEPAMEAPEQPIVEAPVGPVVDDAADAVAGATRAAEPPTGA